MKNVKQALEGLRLYCGALGNMDVEEFDFLYNLVVRCGLTNSQIEKLYDALSEAIKTV